MPQAELNICFGYGEPLAQKVQEKFGVPYIKCAYPYGVAGMQKFLRQLGEALKIDFPMSLLSWKLRLKSSFIAVPIIW